MTVWEAVEDGYADRRSKDDCSRLGLALGGSFGSGKEGIKEGIQVSWLPRLRLRLQGWTSVMTVAGQGRRGLGWQSKARLVGGGWVRVSE